MKLLIQRLDISKRKKEELKRKDVKLRKELIKYSSNKNILRMNQKKSSIQLIILKTLWHLENHLKTLEHVNSRKRHGFRNKNENKFLRLKNYNNSDKKRLKSKKRKNANDKLNFIILSMLMNKQLFGGKKK